MHDLWPWLPVAMHATCSLFGAASAMPKILFLKCVRFLWSKTDIVCIRQNADKTVIFREQTLKCYVIIDGYSPWYKGSCGRAACAFVWKISRLIRSTVCKKRDLYWLLVTHNWTITFRLVRVHRSQSKVHMFLCPILLNKQRELAEEQTLNTSS